MHHRSRSRLFTGFAIGGLLLAACGSSSSSDASSSASTSSSAGASSATTASGGYGGAGDTTPATTATTSGPATSGPATSGSATAGTVSVGLADSSLGRILTDGAGKTLYLFTNDTPTTSACDGGCAAAWPALVATGPPELGAGLSAEDFGTLSRADGTTQVTFYGHPLYYYAADAAPGDTNGQGVGKVWFVVDGEGNPITT